MKPAETKARQLDSSHMQFQVLKGNIKLLEICTSAVGPEKML
jgi:hypothetical protein